MARDETDPPGAARSIAAATPAATPSATPSAAPLSASVGDYLKAIWVVGPDGPAATGDIARELDVTAQSVTGMLGKLKRMGLIEYQRYYGAELTPEGRAQALRLIRKHRLLETFLIRDLGFSWDEVHEQAEAMEHVMSDRFTDRLAEHLGQPTHDPHGDPIPRPDGTLPVTPDAVLAEVEVGRRFRVSRVLSQDAEVLAYLERLRIRPGAQLTVLGREPRGNMLELRVADAPPLALSRELASVVLGTAGPAVGPATT